MLPSPTAVAARTPCAEARPGSSAPLRGWPLPRFAVPGLVLLGALLRLAHLVRAPIALDELEHTHAAFLVSRGQVPYRDFFQHHPPLYYLVVGRLPIFRSPGWSTLLWVRTAALVAAAASFLLLWRWARTIGGGLLADVTAALLALDYFAARHGTHAFLDTFAAPFVLGALVLAGTGRPGGRRMAAAGVSFAISLLFTQKMIVFAPALLVGMLRVPRGGPRRRAAAGFLAGALLPCVLCALAVGPSGTAGFFREVIWLNLRWKARHRPVAELASLLVTGGAVSLLAVVHVARRVAASLRGARQWSERDVPVAALACAFAGLVVIPVVYAEYFVLPVQLAALVAAMELARLCSPPTRHRAALVLAGGCALLVPLALQVVSLRVGNGADRARLAFVDSIVAPGEPVFDTYRGFGLFRPHAYEYWLLHDELQKMVGDRGMARDIVAALERERPPVVLEDVFARTLPAAVKTVVRREYVQSSVLGVWCRRDRAVACGDPADAHAYGGP